MKVRDTNHDADFHDLCPRQDRDFVGNLSRTLSPTLSPTFPVHCNGPNSIRATQTGLSRTCHGLCRKLLDMSRWFVFATFVICVRGEVSVKVGAMEFGLDQPTRGANVLDRICQRIELHECQSRNVISED